MSSLLDMISDRRRPPNVKADLKKALDERCLDVDDINNAIEYLGRNLVVYTNPHHAFDESSKIVSGYRYPVHNLIVNGAGALVVGTIHAHDGTVLHFDDIKAINTPLEDFINEVESNPDLANDEDHRKVPVFFSLEDLRARYEAQVKAERKWKIEHLKRIVTAYDPSVFAEKANGEADRDTIWTGDLVRAKPGLHGIMSPDRIQVAYVFDKEDAYDWIASWNTNHNDGMEQADVILAKLDDHGRLNLSPASSNRLQRITEEDALTFGNGFNPEYVKERNSLFPPDPRTL